MPHDDAGQSFLSLHAVRVFVRDLDRSARFYVDQLGFRLVIDTRLQNGERWVAVSPPDGTAVLTLVAPAAGTVEHKLIGRATQVVLITSDVTGRFQEWSRKGVRFTRSPRLRRIKYEPADVGGRLGGAAARGRDARLGQRLRPVSATSTGTRSRSSASTR